MSEEKNKGFTKLEDIITWQKSKTLAIDIYKITYEPLFSKDFGLKDQIRRDIRDVINLLVRAVTLSGVEGLVENRK